MRILDDFFHRLTRWMIQTSCTMSSDERRFMSVEMASDQSQMSMKYGSG
jgi:hypothetical protein